MLSIFACAFWPFVYLLLRNVYLDLLLIFSLGCLFWYWAAWVICIFWRLIPCWSFHLQIFFSHSVGCLHFHNLSFHNFIIHCLIWGFICSSLPNSLRFKVILFFFCFVLFCLVFLLFRATPMAYGSSQARSQIRATDAGLCHSHSNAGSELCLRPTLQLMAMAGP